MNTPSHMVRQAYFTPDVGLITALTDPMGPSAKFYIPIHSCLINDSDCSLGHPIIDDKINLGLKPLISLGVGLCGSTIPNLPRTGRGKT